MDFVFFIKDKRTVMQDYKNFDTQQLIDLLSRHTTKYTHRIVERNNSVELCQLEYEIALIQSELNSRMKVQEHMAHNLNSQRY